MHLRMTGNLLLRPRGDRRLRRRPGASAPAGEADARRPARALVHRRPAVRPGRGAPGRRHRALLRIPARGRAARGRVDRRGALRVGGRAAGAAEVVSAQPGARGRDRQHLRRRGAVARAPSPALAGRLDEARALRGAADGDHRGARGGPDPRGLVDRRLSRRPRRAGLDAGRVPRPHPGGRGVPARRRGHPRGSWSAGAPRTSARRARSGCVRSRGEEGGGGEDDRAAGRVL